MIKSINYKNNICLATENLQINIQKSSKINNVVALVLTDRNPKSDSSIFDEDIGDIEKMTTIINVADTINTPASNTILNILDNHPIFCVFYTEVLAIYCDVLNNN